VTPRALVLGLLLIPLNIIPMALSEVGWMSSQPTSLSIFANVIATLFLLSLLNRGLQKWSPRLALRRTEIITIFAMLTVAQGICAYDRIEQLMGHITHAYRWATPENKWQDIIWPYLPSKLMVSDRAALRAYYEGGVNFWQSGHLGLWARPFGFWLICAIGVGWTSLCLVSLVRRRWIDHEKLSFPLAQVPLEVTARDGSIFSNPLFWIAFGLAVAWSAARVGHYFLPGFPRFNRGFYLDLWSSSQPWRSLGDINFSYHPFPISIAYFMPLDLAFSAWFFYLLSRGQIVLRHLVGVEPARDGRLNAQALASWLTVVIMALYRARSQLAIAWEGMLRGTATAAEAEEALSYRTNVVGLALGVVLLTWFAGQAGVALPYALFFWAVFFLIVLAAARIRAELGAPATELDWKDPSWMLTTVLGTEAIGAQNLTGMAMMSWLVFDHRGDPTQHMLESYKLADSSGLAARGLAAPLMLALTWGFTCGYWSVVTTYYSFGAGTASYGYAGLLRYPGMSFWSRLANWISNGQRANWWDVLQVGAGLLVTVILQAFRDRYLGFPLHPIGFAMGWSWTLHQLWFTIFVGWLIKAVILRYGGLRVYRQLTPWFVGLLVGDFTAGFAFLILGQLLKVRIGGVPF
jgi:hypothetical protein